MGIISWFVNQLITGGPHPVPMYKTLQLVLSILNVLSYFMSILSVDGKNPYMQSYAIPCNAGPRK